ncbi:uncharacterized protein LOC130445987 [Diorhabda sublineata]|uniref:uncharacterized protein LOC130445987 n=1 Tax=Diorhabda sublineata TaxID=1163346 RepID=UPI0024E15889|nr:uncharacterized protein LOC130445987 [Diorhabda sublineata]
MAFSQKHTGKVFVPWFNTSEWQGVYSCVISNLEEDKRKALDILKIWKLRTPLLSAGVTGTLILLETLLSNIDGLTELQIVQIYSISLLRFLNICAANNDKQGTFNKTVLRNDLPKWLIDIRHDIAHSNKLPSKTMLELALNYSFEWLIEKYWKIQNDTISDYFVSSETKSAKVVDTLNTYIGLSLNIHMNADMKEYEEALMKKVNYLVSKRYHKPKTDKQSLLVILEEILKQSLADSHNSTVPNKVAEILTDVKGLLGTNLEEDSEGNPIISENFKLVWTRLLNILYENECLTALLEKLFSVAVDPINQSTKKVAFTWLHNILDGLLKIHFIKNRIVHLNENEVNENGFHVRTNRTMEKKLEFKNCISFECIDKLPIKGMSTLENKIIDEPGNPESIQLLEKVMILNNRSKDVITTFIQLMKTFETPDNYDSMNFNTVSTIEDIPLEIETIQILDSSQETNGRLSDVQEETTHSTSRWNIEKDTSKFKGYPLGIMPKQNRNENPLITFH